MNHLWTDDALKNKDWTLRTKIVSSMLDSNKTVLDLGCGDKEILKYYTPSAYCGIDIRDDADLKIDLSTDFVLESKWDYILCCGIIEYLPDPKKFLSKIHSFGDYFIISWLEWNIWNPIELPEFEKILEEYFIIEEKNFEYQVIYKCRKK